MMEIKTTSVFDAWFDALRDRQAQARIQARLRRLSQGNAGAGRHLGGGVSELKIDYGLVLHSARAGVVRAAMWRR